MISRQDLKQLLSIQGTNGNRVLSVYLDIDQGRAVNLNRGFEAAFKSLVQGVERGLTEQERKLFLEVSRRAGNFILDFEPAGKSIVYFCDSKGNLNWHRSLGIELKSRLCWGRRPCVRPLLEARDEFERYGVVIADRAKARLFTIYLGAIEESREAFATAEVKKFDASGSDQMRSQMHFQHKADEHARQHLKHVADLLEKTAASEHFDRLILGGTHEVVSELKGFLSDRHRRSVVGTLNLPVDSGTALVLSESLTLLRKAEREAEEALVSDMLTQAAKGQPAVVGFTATLGALRDGRIRQIVYADDVRADAVECSACAKVFETGDSCLYCAGATQPVSDVLESIVAAVFEAGGEVEQVRGEAARKLLEAGEGIGALLRF